VFKFVIRKKKNLREANTVKIISFREYIILWFR